MVQFYYIINVLGEVMACDDSSANDILVLQNLPVKDQIKKTYDIYLPYLQRVMQNIYNLLQKKVTLSAQPTYKLRVKHFDSYYKKVLRVHGDIVAKTNDLVCITDIIGIRIICAFLEDVTDAKAQLLKMFDVKEVEVKGASQSFKEFGYESIHVLINIPKDCIPLDIDLPAPQDLVCEIQIRTILQDAWAEVEHELIYKTEFTPFDMPLRRKLASMNASLSLADIIFQEIRDYQKKLQRELNTRRESFYKLADDLTNFDKSEAKLSVPQNIERVNPFVAGTIDDLILQAIQAHNAGNLDEAVHIYTLIINSKPSPSDIVLSVIYKHRGMAYFTQNNHEKALNDFKESFLLDDKNFRSIYYEGIVYSIQGKYSEAADCFTKSLELNQYQSHAFFRRANAYYALNQYEKAMNDVAAAQKLGLEDKGLDTLHAKLLEKFDMKF